MQTLVTKLVNYKSEQGAEGELSCFGDEWMATTQRGMEGEGSQGERRKRRRMAKKRKGELNLEAGHFTVTPIIYTFKVRMQVKCSRHAM